MRETILHNIETYNYYGEWIVFITNADTDEIEWFACNYRTYCDMVDDINIIRNIVTLDELHAYEPTIPQDETTLEAMKQLKYKGDCIRRALWHKQSIYLEKVDQIFFEIGIEEDTKIIVYNDNTVNFSVIVVDKNNDPVWLHGGYSDFRKVMHDVRTLQKND